MPFECWEHDQSMQFQVLDDQPRLLLDFPADTILRRFACLEFPTQSIPFPLVDIVWRLDTMLQI